MAKFTVPEEYRHQYKMLVQRANRRIKSNLKYIHENKVTSEHTKRSLVAGFSDGMKWASGRMPFSRSIKGRYLWDAERGENVFREFESQTEFNQYLNYLSKWGAETEKGMRYDAHPETIKSNYKSSIIKALNQVKDHYNITLPNGQIPKEILNELDSMSLEQITNFFANGDPSEDIEISQFSSDEFIDVTNAEDFTDVVMSRIGMIKRFH